MDIEYTSERLFVNLFKWGTETSLLIDLTAFPSTQHKFLETENKIEVENPDLLLRVYPIDTRSTGDFYGDAEDQIQCHDGGLRFELVFKKKRPDMDNSFTFPVIAKNLRFGYQPFLTQEDIDAGISCPINVEGSYAVYHTTKKNNQYRTGKAFHLFRPIAEDALGNKAWCSLHIDKAIDPTSLTITVPQQFLDEATYPITIDPDFGYTSIGTSSGPLADAAPTSWRLGSAWAMPVGGGTANYIRAYIGAGAGTPTVDCKAFINQKDSVAAGQHGQTATDEELACIAAFHWEEFTLGGEVLTGGVDYILNVMGNTGDVGAKEEYSIKFDVDGATAVASYVEAQTYGAPESPWVDAAMGTTRDYSIYCHYSSPFTFGFDVIGTLGTQDLDDRISGSVFTCREAGVAQSITAYIDGQTGSPLKYAIYRHSDLDLIGETVAGATQGAGQWITLNFSDPKPNLVATNYILVAWADRTQPGAPLIYYSDGNGPDPGQQGHFDAEAYGVWPDPLVPTHEDRKYSIYLTYTEPAVEEGGLRMTLSLKGHMGYDLKTRGGKARRRMW